jgi:hypothetical protein
MKLAHLILLALVAGMFTLTIAAARLNPILAWCALALLAAGLITLQLMRST